MKPSKDISIPEPVGDFFLNIFKEFPSENDLIKSLRSGSTRTLIEEWTRSLDIKITEEQKTEIEKFFSDKDKVVALLQEATNERAKELDDNSFTPNEKHVRDYILSVQGEKEQLYIWFATLHCARSFFTESSHLIEPLYKTYRLGHAKLFETEAILFLEIYAALAEKFYSLILRLMSSVENARQGKFIPLVYDKMKFGTMYKNISDKIPPEYKYLLLEDVVVLRNAQSHGHYELNLQDETLTFWDIQTPKRTLTADQMDEKLGILYDACFEMWFKVVNWYAMKGAAEYRVWESINNSKSALQEKLAKYFPVPEGASRTSG